MNTDSKTRHNAEQTVDIAGQKRYIKYWRTYKNSDSDELEYVYIIYDDGTEQFFKAEKVLEKGKEMKINIDTKCNVGEVVYYRGQKGIINDIGFIRDSEYGEYECVYKVMFEDGINRYIHGEKVEKI